MNPWEIAANVMIAASIVLAGRNNIHTWWTGIIGCLLFGYVFFADRLYANVTLQGFFVLSCIVGWWRWKSKPLGDELPVRRARPKPLVAYGVGGAGGALAYGSLLHAYTDANAPFLDSIVLAFSVVAQVLMVQRLVESWWFWLLVNTVAVPLYLSQELYLTSVLYAAFWINTVISLRHWRRLAKPWPIDSGTA